MRVIKITDPIIMAKPSPYILFCAEVRDTINERLPELSFGEKSRYRMYLWTIAPDSVKAKYGTVFNRKNLFPFEKEFHERYEILKEENPTLNFAELFFISDSNAIENSLKHLNRFRGHQV